MDSLRPLPLLVVAVALLAATAPVTCQQDVQENAESPYKAWLVNDHLPALPFPPGSETRGPVKPIEFRSPAQMTPADRDVEADGESSIRERVSFVGLEFNQGTWTYQQIVCPVFPNHVLLKFMRNNGTGDESVFTASIPRMGEGRVRIIPVLRRGYSLFSPTPVNALTISAFNHIRAEEHPSGPPDWLGTGMCYAALAGAHPQVALKPEGLDAPTFNSGVPAALQIPAEGGAVIDFLDVAAKPVPMEWSMIFDKKGRLIKASRTVEPPHIFHPMPPTLVELHGTPIPPTVDVGSNPTAGRSEPESRYARIKSIIKKITP